MRTTCGTLGRLGSVAFALCALACGGSEDASGSGGAGGAGGGAGAGATGGTAGATGGAAGATGGSAGASGSAGSSGGSSGSGGSAGSGGAPVEGEGCTGVTLLEPGDYGSPGPWPVGARTLTLQRGSVPVVADVWYPAERGSQGAAPHYRYDIRESLPVATRGNIPDQDNPWQDCDCWRDLPVDAAHGPYPIIVFVHGTGAFRTQNLSNVTHWASRGFIVVAANHPGLYLGDLISTLGGGAASGPQDLAGDVRLEIGALDPPSGDLAFLAGHVDLSRVGLAGHSAGGGAVASLAALPGAQVIVPMSSGGSPSVASTVNIGGQLDFAWGQVQAGYAGRGPKRRLLGVGGIAHAGVTDVCSVNNSSGKDLLSIAVQYNVLSAGFLGLAQNLFDCAKDTSSEADAAAAINYITALAFEETLHCDAAAGTAGAAVQARYPIVSTYQEDL